MCLDTSLLRPILFLSLLSLNWLSDPTHAPSVPSLSLCVTIPFISVSSSPFIHSDDLPTFSSRYSHLYFLSTHYLHKRNTVSSSRYIQFTYVLSSHKKRLSAKIPGDEGLFLFGHIFEFGMDPQSEI